MTQMIPISPEVAERVGVAYRCIQHRCSSGYYPGAKKIKGRWHLATTDDSRLGGVGMPEHKTDELAMADIAKPKIDEALGKLTAIKQCEKFIAAAVREGATCGQAVAMFSKESQIAIRTIQRWRQAYRQDGLKGIIDRRGGIGRNEIISPGAWEYFESLWLTRQQPTVKMCRQIVEFVNKNENKEWQIPSLRYMQKMAANIPLPIRVLYREGQAAYDARCAPYIKQDPDSVEPGAVWIGDHHQLDCWVRYRNGWLRPWLTAWEDMRSRAIVGWCISPAPNQSTIMLAMKRGIEKHGPPDAVKIDNGRDYDSEMWTGTTKQKRRVLQKGYLDKENVAGIYALLGINVSFAIPYHPQSKKIERFFGTICSQFTKTIPTYCGKDTKQRPEELADYLKTDKAAREAYSLDEFAELLGQYVETYNHSSHSGDGMDGRSPMDVLGLRTSRRVLADGVLQLLMRTWTGELVVGKNGVNIRGLYFGQFDTAISMNLGRKVRCAYDPDDMGRVWVYESKTYQLITIAEQAQLVGYGAGADERSLREATAAKNRARKIVRQSAPAAKIAATDLPNLALAAMADRIRNPKSEIRNPKFIRPVATVMDGQVETHRRLANQKAVRKAAGAENIHTVVDLQLDTLSMLRHTGPDVSLNFDFDKIRTGKTGDVDLKLFKNG